MKDLIGKQIFCAAIGSFSIANSSLSQEESRLKYNVNAGNQRAAVGLSQSAFDVASKADLSISYDHGLSLVSNGQARELTALVKGLDKSPRRLNVTVAAWADADYPSDQGEELSTGAEFLADRRANAVASYLAGLASFSKVSKFNMAKRSNMFERIVSSDESLVKDAVYGKATNKYWLNHEAKIIRDKGGSRKVIVIIYDVNQRVTL